ncbi:hypothetical protein BaRGS_00038841 [Batillaria attramentaria]|uniref:Bis(monoacylglycero)phosphate synthase CLN5 n=1 Tax=Batillaria attramentaria TaxID=370345 RepID=A0ABD0J5K9_9CAEN
MPNMYLKMPALDWSRQASVSHWFPRTTFNLFANWTEMDNNTNVFYQTWTVREEPGGKMWFDSCDASLWVQRAFAAMAESGASFNHSVHLNYTKIYLYSKTAPVLLGNADIFTDKKKVDIATEIRMFYHRFRPHQSLSDLLKSYVDTYYTIVELGRFILYYNQTYWQLNMTEPYVDVTYEEVSLP